MQVQKFSDWVEIDTSNSVMMDDVVAGKQTVGDVTDATGKETKKHKVYKSTSNGKPKLKKEIVANAYSKSIVGGDDVFVGTPKTSNKQIKHNKINENIDFDDVTFSDNLCHVDVSCIDKPNISID